MRQIVRLASAVVALLIISVAPADARAELSSSTSPTVGTDGTIQALARDGSKLFLAGSFSRVAPVTGPGASFSRADGTVDSLPKVAGHPFAFVQAVAADGHGGWYVGGEFKALGGTPRSGLAHIAANGDVDRGFDPMLVAPDGQPAVVSLAVHDGVVYASGTFVSVDGAERHRLVALDAATGQPTAFRADLDNPVAELAVHDSTVFMAQPSTGDLLALDATTGAPTGDFHADLPDGSLVENLAVAGNRLYVGGTFPATATMPAAGAVALDATTGARDAHWRPDCAGGEQVLAASAAAVYVRSACGTLDDTPVHGFAALDPTDGKAMPGFDPRLESSDAALTVVPDGATLYVGGQFSAIGGGKRRNLAALEASTGHVEGPAFDPDAPVHAIATSAGHVYAGGDFATAGGVARHNLAAIDLTTGKVDPGFVADTDHRVSSITTFDNHLYAVGPFSAVNGTTRHGLADVDEKTGTVGDFSPAVDDGQAIYITANDRRLYISGIFDKVNGANRASVAALEPDGTLDAAFDPHVPSSPFIGAPVASGSTVFLPNQASSLRPIIAVDSDTGADRAAFDPEFDGSSTSVDRVSLYANRLYFSEEDAFDGGGILNVSRLRAVDATTGASLPFGPTVTYRTSPLMADASGVFVVGGFSGGLRGALARIDPAGVPTPFDPETDAGSVDAVAAGANGELYAAGSFTNVGDDAAARLATFVPGAPAPPHADGNPTITGPDANGELHCTPGPWDVDAADLHETWLVDGQVGASDAGPAFSSRSGAIRCEVTGRNASGGATDRTSAATYVVGKPDAALGRISPSLTSIGVAGAVRPAGAQTSYHFTARAQNGTVEGMTVPQTIDRDAGLTEVRDVLTGLDPDRYYDVTLVAANPSGTTTAEAGNVQTDRGSGRPVVSSVGVDHITATTADAHATIDPQSQSVTYTPVVLGDTDAPPPQPQPAGLPRTTGPQAITVSLVGLSPGHNYGLLLEVKNASGTTEVSADFNTPAPSAVSPPPATDPITPPTTTTSAPSSPASGGSSTPSGPGAPAAAKQAHGVTRPAPPVRCVEPRLRHLKLATARARLRRAHCTAKVEHAHASRRLRGRVLRQSGIVGRRYSRGHRITVTVAR